MLEAQISTAERTKYLNRIVTEIDRLTAISHDLLILSSAESKLASKGICDIGELCAYTYGLLKGKAEEKGLEFTIRGPDRLLIEANGAQMSQVILNLVENAIKYTTEGRVEMSLTNHGSEVIFSVEDTGVGVSSDHLPRLFERFYRVDKARSRSTGGTGLGLSIVKHVVEAHGGSVDVQSSLNSGTTFTIRLPKGQIITESQVSEGNSPSLFD
jgi:two-component system phosphate regulon sensor histidine kinase PhoR